MLIGAYLLMCTIFGTTYLAIKVGVDAGLPPLLFAALRFAIAGPIALAIVLLRGLPLPRRPAQYAALAVVGLLNTTLVYAILFWAEQYVSSGMAAILLSSAPIHVMLIRRRWSASARWVQIVGVITGIAGVGLVILPQIRSGSPAPLGASALLLLACFFLGLGSVKAREAMEEGIHPLALNAFQMLFGGLGLLLGSLLLESPLRLTMGPASWWALAHLSLAGSVLGFGIFYGLVARTGPLFPSTWTYVAPVIATIAGALVLGEPAGWATVGGLLLVLTGAALTDPAGMRRLITREGG
ncbi:MAG: DMT family transporter [Bacillota bacterium]